MTRHRLRGLAIVWAMSLPACALLACAGKRPEALGLREGRLAPCPASPNCVSSDAPDAAHAVAPISLAIAPEDAWATAVATVSELPRTRIVANEPGYLHAESTSRLFRFVDDLELHLRASDGIIAVRSASRVGYSDLGVNRARVDDLRAKIAARLAAP